MTKEGLELAAKFLSRVQLQGNEVPAYNRVMSEMEQDWVQLRQEEQDPPPITQ